MTRKIKSSIIFLSLVLMFVASMSNIAIPIEAEAAVKSSYGISCPRVKSGKSTWDTVYFGTYYQSSLTKKSPIRWRVLWVDGDDAFLLSEKTIIDHCFSSFTYGTTENTRLWENSTLREYLNDDFYNEAFTEEEQDAIILTKVVNNDNVYCVNSNYSEAGEDTWDKIYCLSIDEVSNPDYGFDDEFYEDKAWHTNEYWCSETRESKTTNYLLSTFQGSTDSDGTIDWWLRTPSYNGMSAGTSCVNGAGMASAGSSSLMSCKGVATRPVLHLDLSKTNLWKKGKTVSASNQLNLECKHSYTATEYWENDGKSCRIRLYCSNCMSNRMLDAKVTSKVRNTSYGKIRKSKATLKYKGKTWTRTMEFFL